MSGRQVTGRHANGRRVRGKTGAVLWVVAIFVAGIVAGVAGTHVYYLERFTEAGSIADMMVDIGGRQVSKELELSREQQEQFDRILEDTRTELIDVRRGTARQVIAVRDRAAQRLEVLLDEEQIERLEAMRAAQGRVFDDYLQ